VATVAWNTVEAVVAIAAGAAASSIALVGFGLDSTVGVLSAGVIVWRMTRPVAGGARSAGAATDRPQLRGAGGETWRGEHCCDDDDACAG